MIFGRVILLNGSPNREGSTYKALCVLRDTLSSLGVDAEIIHVGDNKYSCQACSACQHTKVCKYNDKVVEVSRKLKDADGLVLASPVYYASPAGGFVSFLDRLFYSTKKDILHMTVGASVAVARRSGCTATFDVLNKYFTISGMPIVSADYWNNVHGKSGDDVYSDLEGMHTMRALAHNMAYLIRAIKLAKETIGEPSSDPKVYTNFIR